MKKFLACLLIIAMLFSTSAITAMADSNDEIVIIIKNTDGKTVTNEDGDVFDAYGLYIKAPIGTTIYSAEIELTGYGLRSIKCEEGWKVGPLYYYENLETRFKTTCTATAPWVSQGGETLVGYIMYAKDYIVRIDRSHSQVCDADGILMPHYVKNEIDNTYVSHAEKFALNYSVKEGKGYLTSEIPSGTYVTDGTEFALTAMPAPGYKFSHWENAPSQFPTESAVLWKRVTENMSLEACFVENPDGYRPKLKNGNSEATNNPFTDVKEGAWYKDAVVWAYNNKLLTGVSSTKFDPNGKVTRGMVATVVGRFMAEYYDRENENFCCATVGQAMGRYDFELDVKDAKKSDWFYNGIKICFISGMMSSASEMKTTYDHKKELATGHIYFEPYKNATRKEVAVALGNFASLYLEYGGVGYDEYENGRRFWDGAHICDGDQIVASDNGSFDMFVIRKVLFYGIMNGTPGADGKLYFNPDGEITRAEFAQILMKTAEKLNDH